MLEEKGREQTTVVDKHVFPNANYIMEVRDQVMRPEADGVSGPITVVLPPVGEAKGMFYSIVCRNADPVNTVTITDQNDSECWNGDFVLNGKCDALLLYSDGMFWWTMQDLIAHAGTTPAPTTAAATTVAPTTAAPTSIAPTTAVPI